MQDNRVVLKIGYSSGAFSRGFLKDAQVVLESLGTNIARQATETFSEVSALIYDGFQEFEKAIESKEVDIVILNSLDFLTFEDKKLLEPRLVGSNSEGMLREFVVLIRKDRGIDDISQLKDMSFLVETGGVGRTPRLWLEVFLTQQGNSDVATYFKDIQNVEKSSQAVLPVFFKKVDACLTLAGGFRTIVDLNPQVGAELNIIAQSPKLLRGVVCFRTNYEEKLKNIVIAILEKLHEQPDGQQILMVMREERLLPFRSEYLETSRELFKLVQPLQQNH